MGANAVLVSQAVCYGLACGRAKKLAKRTLSTRVGIKGDEETHRQSLRGRDRFVGDMAVIYLCAVRCFHPSSTSNVFITNIQPSKKTQ
ncbi:MAG: hypothetical protein U0X91_21740 [Spirosomataceae bacterium]